MSWIRSLTSCIDACPYSDELIREEAAPQQNHHEEALSESLLRIGRAVFHIFEGWNYVSLPEQDLPFN